MKVSGKRFLVCIAVCLVLSVVLMFVRGIARADSVRTALLCLSDAFFVPGALMILAGALVWVNSKGVADGLGYSVGRFFSRRGPGYEENRRESYSEYKERRHSKKPCVAEMLLTGLAFTAVSVVLTLVFSGMPA